ncbi:hypothetical protein C8F01DRAFT_1087639 [Mycena amicta]|nr:hypothetical protein C8F01DRAFT_1087639 [Mycena amicta]
MMNEWGYGTGNWLNTRYTQVTLDKYGRISRRDGRSTGVHKPHIRYGNRITKTVQCTAYYGHQGPTPTIRVVVPVLMGQPPVKVGGKSTTARPVSRTLARNTAKCGTHEDATIWMVLEEKWMLEVCIAQQRCTLK